MENDIINYVIEQLNEEKWTRATIENYTIKNFVRLDEIIEKAIKQDIFGELKEVCLDHIKHSPKSIIALYILGIITFEKELIKESYIYQVINLYKENKKINDVEH